MFFVFFFFNEKCTKRIKEHLLISSYWWYQCDTWRRLWDPLIFFQSLFSSWMRIWACCKGILILITALKYNGHEIMPFSCLPQSHFDWTVAWARQHFSFSFLKVINLTVWFRFGNCSGNRVYWLWTVSLVIFIWNDLVNELMLYYIPTPRCLFR